MELHRSISILTRYVKVEVKGGKTMHYTVLKIPYRKIFKQLLVLSNIYFTADETGTYSTLR